mgnify:CR=1 FL=1
MSIKVRSDRADKFNEGMNKDMPGMPSMDVIPVDLYGKRVFPNKADKNNLTNAQDDIRERYDLEGDAGLKPA